MWIRCLVVLACVFFFARGSADAQTVINYSPCTDSKTTTFAQGAVSTWCTGRADFWVSSNSFWNKWRIVRAQAWTQSFVCLANFTEHLAKVEKPSGYSGLRWEESIYSSSVGAGRYVQKAYGQIDYNGSRAGNIIQVFNSRRCLP